MKDKNGQPLSIGNSVDVDQTETNYAFNGVVDSARGDHIVVIDMEDNFFCVESINLKKTSV